MTAPLPRPSATVCCFRGDAASSEVLMVQRSSTARFMASAWVFPGGVVDEIDSEPSSLQLVTGVADAADRPWVLAAARELVEEVGIWLTADPFSDATRLLDEQVYAEARTRGLRFDGSALTYFANWVTPTLVPVRFDARFYAAVVPADTVPYPDASEISDARWIAAADALDRGGTGDMLIPFPTMKTLEQLDRFTSAGELIEHARALDRIEPIQPRMRFGTGGELEIVLPGEPGFDEIDETEQPNPEALRRAATTSASGGTAIPEVDL